MWLAANGRRGFRQQVRMKQNRCRRGDMIRVNAISATVLASLLGLALAGCAEETSPTPGENGERVSNSQTASPDSGTPENPDASRAGGGGASGPTTDAGADPDAGPVLPAPSDLQSDDSQPSPAASSGETQQVRILDWQGTLDLVKQHKGKVVVLDLWSHDCTPCLRELPHFVALSKKHPDEVVCIGFNADYTGSQKAPPESFREPVAKMMKSHDADLLTVISNVPSIELFDSLELGAVPAVYVFDQAGNQARRFDNDNAESEFTYEKDVVPFVETLLGDGE
jgi:thiol-disulfide isomerase/thioredoxin